MNLSHELKNRNKKTISKDEIKQMMAFCSDEELYRSIKACENDGVLLPIFSSGTNGNLSFPVYLKYRILTEQSDYSNEFAAIDALHPKLQSNGYLRRKPQEYQKHQANLLRLNRFFFNANAETIPISKKERAFQIFGEEKTLDERDFIDFLARLGITSDTLQFYDTPDYCFPDYIPIRKEKMTLLICENKDIWFNLRRRMFEDHAATLFGVALDGVVFGCGNRVSEPGAVTSYAQFYKGAAVDFLYWGDIDREGLNIYLRVVRANSEVNIRLFTAGYEQMLLRVRNRVVPNSQDHREQKMDYTEIFTLFSEQAQQELTTYLEQNKRVPQEVVSYAVLLESMR